MMECVSVGHSLERWAVFKRTDGDTDQYECRDAVMKSTGEVQDVDVVVGCVEATQGNEGLKRCRWG